MNVMLEWNKKYNLLYFSSLFSKQSDKHLKLMSVCLYTLIPMFAQLFPLEILDFFNEFLKSGIRWNEP